MDSPGARPAINAINGPNAGPQVLAPCRFPRFNRSVTDTVGGKGRVSSARVTVQQAEKLIALSKTDPDEFGALLRAAWALLLRCYTGQDDVSFGFCASGDDPCSSLACFALSDDAAVSEILGSAKTGPIANAVKSDKSDTGIVVWTASAPLVRLQALQHEKLRLLVKIGDGVLGLFLEWSTNQLGMPLSQGRLVASTLGQVLSELLTASPSTLVRDLAVLSDANAKQVHEWNDTVSITPVVQCIHHVIAKRATDCPSAEAVCAWDGTLTYTDLEAVASRLAAKLMRLGVGPEVLVPLCFEKSKWTVVAMVAVLKAGGAFVPLDPSHPAQRLRSLCESVNASLVLCSRKHEETVKGISHDVLVVDEAVLEESDTAAPSNAAVSPANAAYVIFTSGSSGKPKGTLIEHQAFCSSARAHAPALLIDETCRVLQFAAHTFDASLVEILTPLMVGACVCIPNDLERLDDLSGAINRLGVNHAVLTPSFVGFLSPAAVPDLRRLVLAGEAMSSSHVATWSHIELVNGYGPAESSVAAVCNPRVGPGTDPTDIGLPCGVRVWLVDPSDHHKLVPVGCIGEMLLEGPSLARGYLNDIAKTEESFVFDPNWATNSGSKSRRFYKTGDLARYSSASGSLTYVGRKDTQIKLHGQRIELGEIEHHLATHDSIQHGMVILPRAGPLKGRVVAVASLSRQAELLEAAPGTLKLVDDMVSVESGIENVRLCLKNKLPAYMVPSVWICVQAIPMLVSRKMDRKAVTTWVESGITSDECERVIVGHQDTGKTKTSALDRSMTGVEARLLQIWSQVLGLSAAQIDVEDRSFVSLGGDSITAMTCASHAKKAQLGLSVQDILRAKSLRQLAAAATTLEGKNQAGADRRDEKIDEPFDLSPIQQLHFQTRGRAEGDEHFNQSFCLRLARHVDPEAVQSAIRVLVRRHGMLRARFERSSQGGQWRQFISGDDQSSYRFRTCSVPSGGSLDAGIASAQECLDISHGPVFAAELFNVAGGQVLFMTAHHLVIDLVSWRIILEELEEILENPSSAGVHHSLSFQTWTEVQRDDCVNKDIHCLLPSADRVLEANLSYWGMDGTHNLYGDVVCDGFEIEASVAEKLLSGCLVPFRADTIDLLLAALVWSFGQVFTDRSLPTVFNEGHGREPPSDNVDISRTIGWFTTLYPVALGSPESLADAIVQTKDLRRFAPGNGREYFAARFHHPEAVADWAVQHRDMEIAFNFLGRYQQLERAGALFRPSSTMAGEAHQGGPGADFGRSAKRFALFEISAVILQGAVRFTFAWNSSMRHQEQIRAWLPACKQALFEAASTLPHVEPRLTASDLPLLVGLTTADISTFEREKLSSLTSGRGWRAVEDIYPASPIQQGLLMSRTRDRGFYAVRRVFRIASRRQDDQVDVARLVDAWRGVVYHHPLLRTIFIEAIGRTEAGGFDQMVLRDVEADVLVHPCGGTEADICELVDNMERMDYRADRPQHRLSVFHRDGTVVCVLEMSHAIMDGSSMDIMLRDLGRSYGGSLGQSPQPLFKPFIASLRQRNLEEDINFWTSYLASAEPCHFPVLNDGEDIPEIAKELRSLRIAVPNLESLQAFGAANGLTLPNIFTAAWALVLQCYVGTNDVCFGYLVSGRDAGSVKGSEEAIGPFINMASLRVRLSVEANDLSLVQVAEAVQRDQLACMPFAQTSLAEVQHALKIQGGIALFNTCISYRRRLATNESDVGDQPLDFQDIAAIQDPTEYPVSLNIETSDVGAFVDLDYWTDSLSSSQARNVGATFVQALTNIIEHPATLVSEVDLVDRSTKDLIWSWNASLPTATVDCLHRRVEKQALLCPKAQAVRGWDANFSYEEMNSLSDCLASHLADLGVGPEVLVPVCFDKSAWTIIAMLAVLKAGGGVVPLDASHPTQALEGKVIDSDAHVVVASETRASLFEHMVPYVVAVGSASLSEIGNRHLDYPSGVTPDNPAFVMFTSGSTGKPKGVVLCHQALVSSCLAHGSALQVGPHTRFLQFAAHTFDNSIEEMFTTFIHGGCVCVPSEEDRLSDLAGAINTLGANLMDLTPTVAALIQPAQVPGIKAIAVGGEALTQEVLSIWGGIVPLHNQYGPSECSINATHRLHTDATGDVANLGTSVGSISWIVDPKNHNRLMPVGCVGELLIEGPILARGYLKRPELTAEVFVEKPSWASEDPHHCERGSRRMYKTGDLVRYNSDGSLIYLGRKDNQVKLHGQRIELAEIEHHVRTSLPPDAQSSVELVVFERQQKSLVVFISLPPPSVGEVCIVPTTPDFLAIVQATASALAASLASYMNPSVYFPVSKMPLTSSGKLDRRFLRQMAQAIPGDAIQAYRLVSKPAVDCIPETPMERELQKLWSIVLGVDAQSIGAGDSFFRHGGDSIGAMRLAAAARRTGLSLSVASIFQAPRLSDMAKVVVGEVGDGESQRAPSRVLPADEPLLGPTEPFSLLGETCSTTLMDLKTNVASICQIDVNMIEDIYPSTPLQAGLVATSQRQPGAYVAVNAYKLPADTDIELFKAAWQETVNSEAILRTRIVFIEEVSFLQVVLQKPHSISWDLVASIDDVPKTHSLLPPHDGGVLSRYIMIRGNNGIWTFLWMAHHALYDGWSLSTLLSRVESRYRRPAAALGPVPQYSRFVEHIAGLDMSASDAYWTERLSNSQSAPRHFPQLPHPEHRVQAKCQSHRSARFTRPRTTEVTTATYIRTAWAVVLSVYSSSDDVVFCEVLNGRDVRVAGIEELVGPTFASVPRRIRIDRSLESALTDIQAQLTDVIPHQFVGLQRIKSLGSAAAAACQFQNLLAIEMGEDNAEDSLWSRLISGGNKQSADFFNYPLNVTCSVTYVKGEVQFEMRAHFDPMAIPQWLADRMLGQFEAVLRGFMSVKSPADKMEDMQILSPEDRAAISAWNKIPGPAVERCVHEVISEQLARRTSDKAVVGWDTTLSTSRLELLSNALASTLSRRGIGGSRGRLIPLCFEKSSSAIVAMLAVLKAGAAFVPLDPGHPIGRLREIINNCEADTILCSPKYKDRCQELVSSVVAVDMGVLTSIAGEKLENKPASILSRPDDPAYVIWTSGTTGRPKGTIVSHSAFCSGAAVHGPAMLMRPPFRFLQFASYTFDACLVETLTTLMMGGTVCVPRDEDRTNGNIASFMETTGVTMALLTPSFARTLRPTDVPTLKVLILGGEAMSQSDVDTWAEKVHLVNAYGPSECAVVATVNSQVRRSSNPSNIGRGIGRCWIVDPRNYHQLAPVGSVGELLVEGPTLSTGYLRNEVKTQEAFVENPRWALDGKVRDSDAPQSTRRMYKTGDLVRICDDVSGEMAYVGRKDNSQVKVNGQRLELDEITHHLDANLEVQHSTVTFPKSGPFAKRLVAALVLRETGNLKEGQGGDIKLVLGKQAATFVESVKTRLSSKVPKYMVPPNWIVVDHIPLLPSGKLDRAAVVKFLEGMSDQTFGEITAPQTTGNEAARAATSSLDTPIDEHLRQIWSSVLNVPLSTVGPNASFIQLGGDSINAMQVMARCRTQGIHATVQDIVNSKSITELALKVGHAKSQSRSVAPGEDQHEFDPSPIQQLYFEVVGENSKQFNQSVMFRLRKETDSNSLARGIHALVDAHSMLRARFRLDGAGNWRQRITTDIAGSYRFKTHTIRSPSRIAKRIQASQSSLDIQKGPMLCADCFTVTGGEQRDIYIFITVHHLVVDVVSWGILLQDLEDFLVTGTVTKPLSLSFQTWSRAQSHKAQDEANGASLLPHHGASDVDLEYWGMTGIPNLHSDVVTMQSGLGREATCSLLSSEFHDALDTEPLDILLACLLLSFRVALPDRRGTPTIYNESHGREPWDNAVDLSRTVGWFTSLSPVHLPHESSSDNDIVKAVRWVKDYRTRLSGRGRPYFAYRLLTSQGRREYGSCGPVEVMFNYLGQMQNLSRTDTYLEPVRDDAHSLSDIGADVPRFALVEVSARVADGKLELSFSYNKRMDHQASIRQWADGCRQLLQESLQALPGTKQTTLSEFPLIPLTYYGVETLGHRLKDLKIALQDVEDVYPCSPMQSGLLLSQMRNPEKYAYSAIFHISPNQLNIDAQRLQDAWQSVICRHSTLRTIFIDTVGDESLMDQVVLRCAQGLVEVLPSGTYESALASMRGLEPLTNPRDKPPHRFTICAVTGGSVLCRLDISHAISDGSSMPILLNDLCDAYGNAPSRKTAPLYRDYVEYFQSQPRGKSIQYWRNYLSDAEPCLFPTLTDGDSDAAPSLGSQILRICDVDEINDFCADAGITLSTFFQLVWALVLRAYTGSDEVLFGYLASGRDIPVANIENGVGAFINMLVCRLNLPPATELGDIIETLKTDFSGAMEHQTCSLAEIQHQLHLPGAALFNTAFTYQKRTPHILDGQPTPSVPHYCVVDAADPSEYAIAVNVEAMETAVEVHFSYWRTTVSDAHMNHVSAAFDQAIRDIVSDSRDDRAVDEVLLLGESGVRQISEWNNFTLPHVDRCVHDVIAEHAARMPGSKQAVHGWDASFTYMELENAAEALARHLVAIGAQGSFIPLCFEKSAWAVVAQLAVLKAGGAFVSLDPDHPDDRLKGLMADVDARVVLTTTKHGSKMGKIAKEVVIVNKNTVESMMAAATPSIDRLETPSDAAYVIFTSGTTGKPKGTVIEHAAFCTGAMAHAKAMFMSHDSRVLQFASYTFDASVMETLTCLLVGGCVCIPSEEERINDLAAAICKMGVTWTLLTPSVASTLKPESVPSLETLVTGGEAMSSDHIARWGTQCILVNAYGPTECSVVATTSTKVNTAHQVCNADPSNIGSAVGGRIWVVDPRSSDRLVPIGAVGELLVEGRHVARGYLNMPEQTARSFIREPSWTKNSQLSAVLGNGAPMYLTGDLVRYNSDGSVSYISRKDTQVKVNGRRIELGEIEFHCRAGLPDDARVTVEVVARPGNRGAAKSIAAFFTPPLSTPSASPTAAFSLLKMDGQLRAHAQALVSYVSSRLPAYMLPQLFVPVSTMPWTSSGKLDRKLLRQSTETLKMEEIISYKLSKLDSTTQPRRQASSKIEGTLQQLWEMVMGLDTSTVNVNDNFFHLGGDSLIAMKLVGLASAHRIRLSVVDIFEHPVLVDMAKACRVLHDATAPSQAQPFELLRNLQDDVRSLLDEAAIQCQLPPEAIWDLYSCSPLQEALFTLASKQAGAYVAINTLELHESTDVHRFQAAWQTVVEETDILRTRIVHLPISGFLQAVTRPRPIVWHKYRTVEDAIGDSQLIGSQNGGELTRFAVIRGDDGRFTHFVWAIHHALYDGWSLPRIARRVQDVYEGIERQKGPLQSPSYASFIRYLASGDSSSSEQFWVDQLGGASSIATFPQLLSHNDNREPNFKTQICQIQIDRSRLLADITISTVVRASWAIINSAYTGVDDVVFGETLSGRNIDLLGVEDIAGPTFTTVPSRHLLRREMPLAEFLAGIQRAANRVVPHQHYGLQHIKRLNEDCAGACDFQNILIIQPASSGRQEADFANHGEEWTFQGGSSTESFFTHPLVLECNILATAVNITVHHDQNIISEWQADRLVQQLRDVTRQLVIHSRGNGVRLGDVHAFSPEDRALVQKWNNRPGDSAYSVASCIHEAFSKRAFLHPDRLGIDAWDGKLTYSEIRDFASRLAFSLREVGVREGTLVPVCVARSAWSIVTLLGILMAGGAFVPFDPAHPTTRQKDMLRSISANIMVCSPEYESRFAEMVGKCVVVGRDQMRQRDSALPLPSASTLETAYVLFTSGSTGQPKGVVVAHHDFCSSSRGFALATNMTEISRVFHFASLTFDVALMEVLTPLMIGACVCVPTEQERLHTPGEAISRLQATWAFLTPSVANLIDPVSSGSLKTLVCGGEAMVDETISRWADHVELMNGYGPTEASVLAIVNPHVSTERDRTVIGRAHPAASAWIIESKGESGDWLTPVGAIGELAISGPLLSRGYLDDPEKTAKAFIESPSWAKMLKDGPGATEPTRIYRTGDLVRYRSDGAIEFVGRKDGQVKVNGQRIELGEIESRLSADSRVQLALVVQPKRGLCGKQLVAVVTLSMGRPETTGDGEKQTSVSLGSGCKIAKGPPRWQTQAQADVAAMRTRLADLLPGYMVPTVWVVLESMPVVVSGKLDRQQVSRWVECLDEATYETITQAFGALDEEDDSEHISEPLRVLRMCCAEELRISESKVKLGKSFLSLGGDSIRAMGTVSRARRGGLTISVQDVLRCRSIIHLSQLAQEAPSTALVKAPTIMENYEDFGLSLIQNFYFRLSGEGHTGLSRFNQSFSMKVSSKFTLENIQQAVSSIVARHGMLRALFSRSQNGCWKQRIAKEHRHGFFVHHLQSSRDVIPLIENAQTSLSIESGPVFRADVFVFDGRGDTTISMTAHHLCVDMVSWRIITSDLTEVLETGLLGGEPPIPFSSWCSLQYERVRSPNPPPASPTIESPADLSYWGVHEIPVYGKTTTKSFSLDCSTTSLAMASCHRAFNSEPVDLFLAAIAQAFSKSFPDRELPPLYNETHGRNPPSGCEVDLSRTVGWFTSIYPLVIQVNRDDATESLRRAKDARLRLQDNGMHAFARKLLDGTTQSIIPMEILFNFLGGGVSDSEDLEHLAGSTEPKSTGLSAIADVGPNTRRMALFEISATIAKGQLLFNFIFDNTIKDIGRVQSWIQSCQTTMEEMARDLSQRRPEPTLSDYPLLPLTYNDLKTLTGVTLPRLGITNIVDDVEDIYPCTPVQEGMLINQLRDPKSYVYHAIYTVRKTGPSPIDTSKLARAWQRVVSRHAALRTIFIESTRRGGVFDQVVLRNPDCMAEMLRCGDEGPVARLGRSKVSMASDQNRQLPHLFTICSTPTGDVVVRLQLNHAAVDGGSLAIILEELTSEYAGTLDHTPGPRYSDYIGYIHKLSTGDDISHWKLYLDGLHPCHFPKLSPDVARPTDERQLHSASLTFNRFPELRLLSERTQVTLANILHVAWALVLRKYTESDDVCFGYLVADRDAPVNNIQRIVGTLINMLCCRVRVSKADSLERVLVAAQDEYFKSMQFQRCSLAQVQHELGLGGKSLYNTSISTQSTSASLEVCVNGEINFEVKEGHDPSEFAITLNIDVARGDEGVVLRYWSDHITDSHAQEILRHMSRILAALIDRPSQSVACLDSGVDTRTYIPLKHTDTEATLVPANTESLALIDGTLKLKPYCSASDGGSKSAKHDDEATLAELWRTLLNLPSDFPLGGEDSFFDLGGDSILAMKLVGEARDRGMAISVADVFRHPSFEGMVANAHCSGTTASTEYFGGKETAFDGTITPTSSTDSVYERFSLLAASNIEAFLQTNVVPHVGIFRGGIVDVLPATDFQSLAVTGALLRSRWMLNYFYLDGVGPIDVGRFKRACFKLVDALDILRTAFVPSEGRFLQVVLRNFRPTFRVIEVEDDEAIESYAQRINDVMLQGGEPFVEFTVVKHQSSLRHRILLRISHAQYDGVCLPRILGALQLAYRGDPILRSPPFAHYLRAAAGSLTTHHYNYWKELLEGSSMTQLVRRSEPNYHRSTSGSISCLKRLATALPLESGRVTVATVIKSAWAYALAQLSASSDVVFGHTISGRNVGVERVENMIGPCLNLVPVRVQFHGRCLTARQLMHQIQDQQVANMPHEVLGFREIIRHCTSWPDWTYFTSTVQHQNIDEIAPLALGGVSYQVGCAAASQGDFTDLSILSQRVAGGAQDTYEVMVSFSEDGPISHTFANQALRLLCEAIELFSANPDAVLPSSSELRSRARQVPFDDQRVSARFAPTAHQVVSPAEEQRLAAHVLSAWCQALGRKHPEHGREAAHDDITSETSFFSLGGDMISLGQVAWLLGQGDYSMPSLDDLAEYPTLCEHIGIIASLVHAKQTKRGVAAVMGQAVTPPMSGKDEHGVGTSAPKGDSSSRLAKVLKSAMRLRKKTVKVAV